MKIGLASIPAPSGDYVELARTKQGRLYKKQLLHVGDSFVHPTSPGSKITVTPQMAQSIKKNFEDSICDIVQVPLVDDNNRHVEAPDRNIGEVVGVEVTDTGVYALIDDRRTAKKVEEQGELGKTLIGASAMLHLNYTDTRTGKRVGPTLLHAAVTNRPYITNLEGYEEIIAASADTAGDEPVFFTPAPDNKENPMDLDELLATLSADHGIDVVALQSEVATLSAKVEELEAAGPAEAAPADGGAELLAAFSAVLNETGAVQLSATDLSVEDVAQAVVELAANNATLAEKVSEMSEENDSLKLSAATAEVEAHVRAGRILPTQKDAMIELKIEKPATYEALLPANPVVSLSEDGVTTHDEPKAEEADEITRLSAQLEQIQAGPGRKKG